LTGRAKTYYKMIRLASEKEMDGSGERRAGSGAENI
jgi:hypothetical protein